MPMQTTAKNHFMLNVKLRSLLLFSALLIGAAIAAHAQDTATAHLGANSLSAQKATAVALDAIPHNKVMVKDLEDAFNRADTNHDGKLSRQEAQHFPAVVPRFDQIDSNHDGFLSHDEFNQAASGV